MMVRKKPGETPSARLLGAAAALGLGGVLVFLGVRLGVDGSFVAGSAAGIAIGLLWRPARRAMEAILHPLAFGPGRRGPGRFLAAFCAFFVPPVTSPLAALLVGLVDARAGLVAILAAFGESAVRLALGFDPGPGRRLP